MKVAIDARFYGLEHAGLGRYTLNLVQELAKIDTETEYTLFVWQKYASLDLGENFRVVVVDAPHHTLREQLSLPLAIGRRRFDLVHFPHFVVPVLNFGTPFIVTIHDLIKHKYAGLEATTLPRPLYYLKRAAYLLDMWWAVHRSCHIITPTQHVKRDIVSYFRVAPTKISCIYEGVDHRLRDSPDKSRGEQVLSEYGVEKPYLLYVGNSYPYKNIEVLLEGIMCLPPEFRLVMVGSRDVFVERVEALVVDKRLGHRVYILGYVSDEDLGFLYREAVALVTATLEEGFGLTPLEAMGLGCPVVISDIPTFRETCGPAALYFNPKDPEQFAREVVRLYTSNQLKEDLVKMGYQRVRRFSFRRMAQETLDVYRRVVRDYATI